MYHKYIYIEKGKSVLYVELLKALYGTMQAALLFWCNLIENLQNWKARKTSSSKDTHHMNIRYFYIKNVIGCDKVKLTHQSTAYMVADYFTKPLQGAAFKKFCDKILNISSRKK